MKTKSISSDVLAAVLARKQVREQHGQKVSMRVYGHEFLDNFHRLLKDQKALEKFIKENETIDLN